MAFSASSRYAFTPTTTLTDRAGTTIPYLTRRFVPPADAFALLHLHAVVEGDRLDNVAAAELGDPELFWRICDANAALLPDDLIVPGAQLRITLPLGIPVTPYA